MRIARVVACNQTFPFHCRHNTMLTLQEISAAPAPTQNVKRQHETPIHTLSPPELWADTNAYK